MVWMITNHRGLSGKKSFGADSWSSERICGGLDSSKTKRAVKRATEDSLPTALHGREKAPFWRADKELPASIRLIQTLSFSERVVAVGRSTEQSETGVPQQDISNLHKLKLRIDYITLR